MQTDGNAVQPSVGAIASASPFAIDCSRGDYNLGVLPVNAVESTIGSPLEHSMESKTLDSNQRILPTTESKSTVRFARGVICQGKRRTVYFY